jgi:hypothetical protein
MKRQWHILLLFTLFSLWTCGCGQTIVNKHGDKFPASFKAALEEGTQFELLSLDPGGNSDDSKGFHGYQVLGRISNVASDTRKTLVTAFLKGFVEHDGRQALCWLPRHGVSVVYDGKKIDFVICFQCSIIKVYIEGSKPQSTSCSSSPAPVFNQILTTAKVPLPKD